MAIADLRCTSCFAPVRPERVAAGIHRCAYCGTTMQVSGLGGAILAQADFANPKMHGFTVAIGEEAKWVPGPPPQLVAQIPGTKKGWNVITSQATYDDFDASVSLRLLYGDLTSTEANLKFRRSAKGFYSFGLLPRGSFGLHYLPIGSPYETLVAHSRHPAIRTTPGDVNEIRVVCDGNRIRAEINGTQVLSLRDASSAFGTIGVGAASEVPMAVALVSFVIRDLERAAPVVPVAPVQGDAAEAFDVVLVAPAAQKIQAIKVLREAVQLGLKEAKDMVEAPGTLLRGAPHDRAKRLHDELRALGCDVTMQRSG